MLLDPVRLTDIAKRAGVGRDTAKKWTERYSTFPKPAVNRERGRLWEWRAVEQWLLATGRLPGAIRYRSLDGHLSIRVESSEPRNGGGTRWVLVATFVRGHEDSWTAFPASALKQMTDEPEAAANRLLAGWETARVQWVRDHPDEPMPAHLVGSPWPLEPEPEGMPDQQPQPQDRAALEAERDRLAARLAEIDADLRS